MDHDYDYWFNMNIRFFFIELQGLEKSIKKKNNIQFS